MNARGNEMAVADRGFASMNSARQREIASQGGKEAHRKGVAHEWTQTEAREAGRKGGLAAHRNRRTRLRAADSAAGDAEEKAGYRFQSRNRARSCARTSGGMSWVGSLPSVRIVSFI